MVTTGPASYQQSRQLPTGSSASPGLVSQPGGYVSSTPTSTSGGYTGSTGYTGIATYVLPTPTTPKPDQSGSVSWTPVPSPAPTPSTPSVTLLSQKIPEPKVDLRDFRKTPSQLLGDPLQGYVPVYDPSGRVSGFQKGQQFIPREAAMGTTGLFLPGQVTSISSRTEQTATGGLPVTVTQYKTPSGGMLYEFKRGQQSQYAVMGNAGNLYAQSRYNVAWTPQKGQVTDEMMRRMVPVEQSRILSAKQGVGFPRAPYYYPIPQRPIVTLEDYKREYGSLSGRYKYYGEIIAKKAGIPEKVQDFSRLGQYVPQRVTVPSEGYLMRSPSLELNVLGNVPQYKAYTAKEVVEATREAGWLWAPTATVLAVEQIGSKAGRREIKYTAAKLSNIPPGWLQPVFKASSIQKGLYFGLAATAVFPGARKAGEFLIARNIKKATELARAAKFEIGVEWVNEREGILRAMTTAKAGGRLSPEVQYMKKIEAPFRLTSDTKAVLQEGAKAVTVIRYEKPVFFGLGTEKVLVGGSELFGEATKVTGGIISKSTGEFISAARQPSPKTILVPPKKYPSSGEVLKTTLEGSGEQASLSRIKEVPTYSAELTRKGFTDVYKGKFLKTPEPGPFAFYASISKETESGFLGVFSGKARVRREFGRFLEPVKTVNFYETKSPKTILVKEAPAYTSTTYGPGKETFLKSMKTRFTPEKFGLYKVERPSEVDVSFFKRTTGKPKSAFDFKRDEYTTMFHGTTEKYAQKIKQEGFKDGWVTQDLERAKGYAGRKFVQEGGAGGKPVILELKVPKSQAVDYDKALGIKVKEVPAENILLQEAKRTAFPVITPSAVKDIGFFQKPSKELSFFPKVKTKTETIPKKISPGVQRSFTIQVPKESEKQFQIPQSRIKYIQKEEQVQKQKGVFGQMGRQEAVQRARESEKFIFSTAQKQTQLQRQKQAQRPRFAITPRQTTVPRTTTRYVPPPPTFDLPQESPTKSVKFIPKKREEAGYEVLVKKGGKFIPLGVSVPRTEAVGLGIRKTLRGAQATFRIVRTTKPVKSLGIAAPTRAESLLFRPPKRFKPDTYVQVKTKRIVTPFEKREISYKGAAARRIKW